jgi:hypothetical protein
MKVNIAVHLEKKDRIVLGSYYTPEILVNKIYENIMPYVKEYKKNCILFDNAGGCGAFLRLENKIEYRIADIDKKACDFLRKKFDSSKIFHTNSLNCVSREKYQINEKNYLIMIGNPPYNDITSEFKSGQKGKNICDDELFDRDLGISFLKSYDKLTADLVCVLHPLSYLIKKANFQRMSEFRKNYKLIKAFMFSSAMFHGTGTGKFPIVGALYERDSQGMEYGDIQQFNFDILGSDEKFKLSSWETTDGYINKYPPRKNDDKISPIGLYYYSFRDINTLKKNASFLTKQHDNAIVVTVDNFFKYAYLHTFKQLFNPYRLWVYGNMSPLINIKKIEINKQVFVAYALLHCKALNFLDKKTKDEIIKFYNVANYLNSALEHVEPEASRIIKELYLELDRNASIHKNKHDIESYQIIMAEDFRT